MVQSILMPALSPTMEEGNLAKWLVKEGDNVSSGDVIAEIETDKATMEVESIDDGVIGKIVIPSGTSSVKVGEKIAILLEEGETNADLDNTPEDNISVEAAAPKDTPSSEQHISVSAPQKDSPTSSGDRLKASPLARRMAAEKNISLADVTGSGPKGRIIKKDIEEFTPSQSKPSAQTSSGGNALPQAMTDQEILALYPEDSYEVVPTDGMRQIIAKRLLESKTTIPHFYLNAEVRLDALLELRKKINARSPQEGDQAYKVSVNDFIIKALALALQHIPDANVTWTQNNGVLKHKASDVGVAVSVEGGLFTPVIRDADTKGLVAISREMKILAKKARSKKLMPHEYQGGSTAVSNLGMFGVKNFNAIINPPHASILAIGAGEQKPIIDNGSVGVGTVMCATLSIDHRAVDGALGAELLKVFKELIEDPMALLL